MEKIPQLDGIFDVENDEEDQKIREEEDGEVKIHDTSNYISRSELSSLSLSTGCYCCHVNSKLEKKPCFRRGRLLVPQLDGAGDNERPKRQRKSKSLTSSNSSTVRRKRTLRLRSSQVTESTQKSYEGQDVATTDRHTLVGESSVEDNGLLRLKSDFTSSQVEKGIAQEHLPLLRSQATVQVERLDASEIQRLQSSCRGSTTVSSMSSKTGKSLQDWRKRKKRIPLSFETNLSTPKSAPGSSSSRMVSDTDESNSEQDSCIILSSPEENTSSSVMDSQERSSRKRKSLVSKMNQRKKTRLEDSSEITPSKRYGGGIDRWLTSGLQLSPPDISDDSEHLYLTGLAKMRYQSPVKFTQLSKSPPRPLSPFGTDTQTENHTGLPPRVSDIKDDPSNIDGNKRNNKDDKQDPKSSEQNSEAPEGNTEFIQQNIAKDPSKQAAAQVSAINIESGIPASVVMERNENDDVFMNESFCNFDSIRQAPPDLDRTPVSPVVKSMEYNGDVTNSNESGLLSPCIVKPKLNVDQTPTTFTQNKFRYSESSKTCSSSSSISDKIGKAVARTDSSSHSKSKKERDVDMHSQIGTNFNVIDSQLNQKTSIVLHPLDKPPHPTYIKESLARFGLPECRHQGPFCSRYEDIPEKTK